MSLHATTDAPAQARTESPAFTPRVLVFACNWCSYAGADTAGVSRLQQPPHFRLLRVMCSGRVHPAHVLRAFANGADGVMVSGCHFGDCHYRFGNHRAVEQYAKMQALVRLLGLEPERLRLEWISAAEGVRFAEVMDEFVAQVRRLGPSPIAPDGRIAEAFADAAAPAGTPVAFDTRAFATCLECGRCTAVCPVARHQRFSPRRLISRALSGGLDALAADAALWSCLTCRGCQSVCPMRIDYEGFVLAARAQAMARAPYRADHQMQALLTDPPAPGAEGCGAAPCSHGGVFEQVSLIAARPRLRQQRLDWVGDDLAVRALAEGETEAGGDLFYAGCSPYFAAYFGGATGAGLTESLRSAALLLQRAGVRPAMLANERCCGHHLRLAGRVREAEALEAQVASQLRASGCRRVIAHCPECLVALRALARRSGLACEIVHLSEVLAPARASLRATAGAPEPLRASLARGVAYQDPCRLGRHSGLFNEPRQLLNEAAGIEVRELPHARERAICCGNTAWLDCSAATKRLQTARLTEAAQTGGAALVTACPGCYIHLRCAQEGMTGSRAAELPVLDLWNLLAGTHAPHAAPPPELNAALSPGPDANAGPPHA
jgi:heterodisulfide reductase subunit D